VPLGAITGLGGEPGLGKSALTAFFAAAGSRGRYGSPWSSLFISAEDSAERVIKPRLMALDADLARVAFFAITDEHGPRVPTFPEDLPRLRDAIEQTQAQLVVCDPLNAFLDGDVDSHKDQSIRRVLAPLALLAEELQIAVVVVLHTRKEAGGPAVYRLGGSVGYGGAARSVLGFGRNPDDPNGETGAERILAHVKCNWGQLAPTLVYRHEPALVIEGDLEIDTHRLVYVSETDIDPSRVFDGPCDDSSSSDIEDAIVGELTGRARPSLEVKEAVAKRIKCGLRTVERYAGRMHDRGDLVIERVGFPSSSQWSLPVAPPTATPPPSPPGGATAEPPDSRQFRPTIPLSRQSRHTGVLGARVAPVARQGPPSRRPITDRSRATSPRPRSSSPASAGSARRASAGRARHDRRRVPRARP
jgi:hypothetical protein